MNHLDQGHLRSTRYLSACETQPLADLPLSGIDIDVGQAEQLSQFYPEHYPVPRGMKKRFSTHEGPAFKI